MMKKAWWILLVAILGCSKAQIPVTSHQNATLEVTAIQPDGQRVDGAQVYLNGNLVGKTPYKNEEIQSGRHVLRLMKEGFQLYTEQLVIEEGEFVSIEAILVPLPPNEGELIVAVDQDSAMVRVKDINENIVAQSDKQESVYVLPAGAYFVWGEKPGFLKVVKAVEVKAGESTIVNLELIPLTEEPQPTILILLPDSAEVNRKFTLGWVSTNAERVEIDYVENPDLVGTAQIQFTELGLYYVHAKAFRGNLVSTAVDSVIIYDSTLPPTIQLLVSPDTIHAGEKINVTWRSTNATSVNVDFVTGAELNGQAEIQINIPGTHYVSATAVGPGGRAVDTDTVTVLANKAPFLSFSIAEDTVQLGEAISLRWQSDGYQVVIDQGVGVRGPNGSEKIISTTPGLKIFTATAFGAGNLTTEQKDSVYVAPQELKPPSLQFSVIPDSVEFGEPVAIQWQSDGYQVVIDQGVGVRGPSGSEEVSFANPGKKIFTATAYSEANVTTIRKDSVYVKEAPKPILPVIVLSTTRYVNVDSVATISWFTQNADYVVVDYVNNADLQGSVQVTFSTPGIRLVTATAFNQAGYVSATDTIEVVVPKVNQVDDIIVPANTGVRADRGESGYMDLNAATFEVQTPGKYQIFAEVWYNSGDSQLNESYYLLVRDASGVQHLPQNPNAGIYKVVPDDPGEPHTASKASGIFKLSAGTHVIELYHYAKIANLYPQFLHGPIDGPESVKLLGFRLVYVNE